LIRRDTVPSVRAVTPLLSTGEVIGDAYEIGALLGIGGMAQVYEAHDRLLKRKVAIKIALPTTDPGSIRLEGQALAAIAHPSVVTVHAIGEHRDLPYLVLERIRGIGLDTLIQQRRRRGELTPMPEALELLIAIAEGLVVVHRAGLSHRDVKPANVMLAPQGRVVLMDFGLVLPQVGTTDNPEIEGSSDYMAPESGELDPRSAQLVDLYALGVLAHELLTGVVPDEHADLAKVRRDAPRELVDLIRQLRAPDPRARPESAEVALWHLRGVKDRRPSSAPPAGMSILIADDDRGATEVLMLYVQATVPDAAVSVVMDGLAAMAQVEKRVPDVLFLDLDLPEMSGAEVCMFVRGLADGARCTVVATAGTARPADAELLRLLGVHFLGEAKDRVSAIVSILERAARRSSAGSSTRQES
jgi:serine/threonine protein kinase